jgi:3-dehydroquinate synthetase
MDHLADVKKFAKKPLNEAAFAGMAKSYALVMSKPDTRYVACSDAAELERVRENFLKKKLGLKSADLDASVKAICEHMKADKTKSRLTFYYLLAEHYGKLDAFVKT